MSQIDLYGIGAGRAIAGEVDEDNEKIRQRRLTAAQRAENERRSAALRERFAPTEQATAISAAQQRSELSRAALPYPPSAAFEAESDEHWFPSDSGPDVSQRSGRSMTASTKRSLEQSRTLQAQPESMPHDLYEADTSSIISIAQIKPWQPEGYFPDSGSDIRGQCKAQLEPISESTETDGPSSGTRPVGGLADRAGEVMDALDQIRGPEFVEQLVDRLDGLLQAVRGGTPFLHSTEGSDVLASLDFVEGYVEASAMTDADRQRLFDLMNELRHELIGPISLTPTEQAMVASAAAVSQGVADKSLTIVGVADQGSPKRNRASAVERKAVADPEEEAILVATGANALSLRPDLAGLPCPAKSSLSKDADKRREETLVTITVRSV